MLSYSCNFALAHSPHFRSPGHVVPSGYLSYSFTLTYHHSWWRPSPDFKRKLLFHRLKPCCVVFDTILFLPLLMSLSPDDLITASIVGGLFLLIQLILEGNWSQLLLHEPTTWTCIFILDITKGHCHESGTITMVPLSFPTNNSYHWGLQSCSKVERKQKECQPCTSRTQM